MCYKAATPKQEQLTATVKSSGFDVANYKHYFHADGFEMPELPILTSESNTIAPARWKLLPPWVKTEKDAYNYANTLNAKCEEVFEKASYKNYIGSNRCLIWLEGFYEPHHPPGGKTIPYFVKAADEKPLSLGGIYADWVNQETGEVTRTFSIITTPANQLLTEIHNEGKRMPLIIEPNNRQAWIGNLSAQEIKDLMQPLPDNLLIGYAVSNFIYKKGLDTNIPKAQQPLPPPQSQPQTLF